MNLSHLRTLIAAGESLTLELKKSTAEKDRACRSLCALANGQGELHFGLTPDMLFQPHESKPWNPWIAKAFHRRGIIETWGRGTLKIASLMQAAGLPVPTLQERTQSVVMTFKLPSLKAQLKSSEKSSEKILFLLRQEPSLSAKSLAEKMSLSPRAVEKQIDLLKKDGKLARIGPAKGGHWNVIK